MAPAFECGWRLSDPGRSYPLAGHCSKAGGLQLVMFRRKRHRAEMHCFCNRVRDDVDGENLRQANMLAQAVRNTQPQPKTETKPLPKAKKDR